MFKAICDFVDAQDNGYTYKTGATFPREGRTVTPARIAELSGKENRAGKPLIKEVKLSKKRKEE